MKTNRICRRGEANSLGVPVLSGERVQGEGPHLLHRQHAEQELPLPQRETQQEAVRGPTHPGRGGVWAGAGQEQGEEEGA